ncbi:hypothetical protein TNCV_4637941 [Trichonephila clavipes]|uniref:Uncharacterized protein n=1 Tax=Trichonephila clavipes TaxID=2585209 RepID=A0A8X7BIS9_TRICX|nr:hypothetical protein TNCV_4637941 [Trichonephila clavipes]
MGRLIPASVLFYCTKSSDHDICKSDEKCGTKEEVPCSKAVAVYNEVKGGVDCFNQRRKIPNKICKKVPEPSAPLTYLEIFSRTKHQNKTTWITPEHPWYQCSRSGGSVAHAGHACSHSRVPRAHQAGLSRRSLAGVGLSESVRCHGPGLALLTNGGRQQQQTQRIALARQLIDGYSSRKTKGCIVLDSKQKSVRFCMMCA